MYKSSILIFSVTLVLCLNPLSVAAYRPILNTRPSNFLNMVSTVAPTNNPDDVSGKSITKEIMSFFSERTANAETDAILRSRLKSSEVLEKLDGMHMITLLFQSARARSHFYVSILSSVNLILFFSGDESRHLYHLKQCYKSLAIGIKNGTAAITNDLLFFIMSPPLIRSERDISTFMYGINSLECVDEIDGKLIKLAAKKIGESSAALTSRAIGNGILFITT